MKIETLRDFYIAELKDLFSAEGQILKALPKMAKAATSPALRTVFEEHVIETGGHLEKLEAIFTVMEASPKGKHCKAMEGMFAEVTHLLTEKMPDAVKDAALIAAAQRVEHYEIAGYGCVRTYARILGEDDAAELLDEIVQEEGAADAKLTKLAESTINEVAAMVASDA